MKNLQNSININYYPGHMAKTKKQISEDLKLIDVIIEILDARIPISSNNPDINEIVKNKKKIILLNNSNLDNEQLNKLFKSIPQSKKDTYDGNLITTLFSSMKK